MTVKYVCDECREEFFEKDACEHHEKVHELKRKLSHMPAGTVICPTCKGEGGYYGTDGVDWRTCGSCKGNVFVKEIISYEPVVTT